MKSGGKVFIQVLVVSLIGLAGVVVAWLLLSQGASADADISVSKTANPISLPVPGGDVIFTVRVTNTGSETVTLTSLVDNPYGDLNGKGTCEVTQTILAGDYYECAFTETVSGSAGGDVIDTVTAWAEDGEGTPGTASDSATVSITAGPLDYIKIEDEVGGAGSKVTTHGMTAGQTFQVWAAGYDEYHNYIEDVSVGWSGTGVVSGQLLPTSGSNTTTFTAEEAGTGTIRADHTTATDDETGTITVNPAALNYVKIEDEAGGAGSEVTTHGMTAGQTFQVWAAGYDEYHNYIEDVSVGWSGTGVVSGQLLPTSGSNTTTFTAEEAGTGTIRADHTTATDDETGTITVNPAALNYVKIEDEAGGAGSEVTTHGMTAGQTFQVWAAGYDEYHNYIEDVSVDWSGTGVVSGQLLPTSGSNTTTFTAEEAGTGTIRADHTTATDDETGTITVNPAALNYVKIEDEAGGAGSEVTTHGMTAGQTFQVWAAGYDEYHNYRSDVTVDWSGTGVVEEQLSPTSGSSTTFTAQGAGTGTIRADHTTATDDETGTITVNPGALDYIVICRDANGQNPAYAHTMTTDNTWTLYAAGYDAEDNFRGNETVTWGKTDTLDEVYHSGSSYTFSPSTAPTSGRITANASGKTDETGTITVNVGTLDYIVIEDAAGGTGNGVNTHSLVIGGTFQVWAAGYDVDYNYISDVTVTWTGTDVVAGWLAPASGSSTTFTAEEAGMGTIEADDESGHEDETGLITVQTPVLTIAKSDNPDPVNAGATLAYTIIITNSGDANGTAVIVTEHYDPNFLFQGASPLPDGYPTSNRTWTIDTLEVGASQTIIVWGNVASPLPVGTVLTNRVTLDSDQTTPVSIIEVTDVTAASELTVSKIDFPDPVPVGGNLTYIINYQNGGTAPADDVVITEMYDRQVTFVSADPAPRSGTDNVWDIGGLAVGEGGSIQVTVRVDTPLPDGATLTNRVTIDSAYTSPLTYDETTGVSAPDLVITAAHAPSLFSPGKLMTYTVIYSNIGSLDAKDVVITTTLPLDTIYVDGGWTSSDGQIYTHLVDGNGALSSGASGQAYFVVQYPKYPDQPQQIGAVEFNTPFVISESGIRGDANLDNNTAYVYIGVPDLVITDFTVEPSSPQAGQPVTFTVVVENQGTGVAWNPEACNGDLLDPICGGFYVDVFIASVASYPFERDGDCYGGAPFIEPGLQHTLVITHSGFSGEEIERFYVKVDDHGQHLYGNVPEYDETNNLFNPWSSYPWSYYAYLPLVFR